MPEMSGLARLRGLQPGNGGRYRAGVSATPTTCIRLFPSSPLVSLTRRSNVAWFLVLFGAHRERCGKGFYRSFPVVQLARPMWSKYARALLNGSYCGCILFNVAFGVVCARQTNTRCRNVQFGDRAVSLGSPTNAVAVLMSTTIARVWVPG